MDFARRFGARGGAPRMMMLAFVVALSSVLGVGCDKDKSVVSLRTSGISKPEKGKGKKNKDPKSDDVSKETTLDLTETAAFERSMYPLLKDHCGACHGSTVAPLISQDDVEAARVAVIDSGKVNFKEVTSSRLYLRLSEDKHECWSDCGADAAAMKTALESWVGLLLEINPNFLEAMAAVNITEPKMLVNSEERQITPDKKTASVEAETGTLTAPMATGTDTATGVQYIEVPVAARRGQVNNPNQPDAGGAVFTLMAPVAGKYQVWARVNAATNDSDEVYIRVDNGDFEQWKAPVTMTSWVWVAANKNNGREALILDLAAGQHTIELRGRESGVKFDTIALTANTEFDGSQLDTRPVQVLRYDISSLSGKPNTFFEIEVSKYSDESIKLRRPTIVSDVPLRVKDIRVLVNGKYNPQHNTFNLLDIEVVPPMTRLSNATMIVLEDIDLEDDQISFSFGAIE